MQAFTPISALIGGSLIGLSAVMLLWLDGRIAGVSGIFQGLYPIRKNNFLWRLLFILGLVLGSQLYHMFSQFQFTPRLGYPIPLLFLGGILVGVGSNLSNGCTSGHGVCGMARLSLRSLIACLIFCTFGAFTIFYIRHILGIY